MKVNLLKFSKSKSVAWVALYLLFTLPNVVKAAGYEVNSEPQKAALVDPDSRYKMGLEVLGKTLQSILKKKHGVTFADENSAQNWRYSFGSKPWDIFQKSVKGAAVGSTVSVVLKVSLLLPDGQYLNTEPGFDLDVGGDSPYAAGERTINAISLQVADEIDLTLEYYVDSQSLAGAEVVVFTAQPDESKK